MTQTVHRRRLPYDARRIAVENCENRRLPVLAEWVV